MKPKQLKKVSGELIKYDIINKHLLKKYGFSVNDIKRGLYAWNEYNDITFEKSASPDYIIRINERPSSSHGTTRETHTPITNIYIKNCYRNKSFLTFLIAHEFGHFLGFKHDVGGVMQTPTKDSEKTPKSIKTRYVLPQIFIMMKNYEKDHCDFCGEYIIDRNCKCGEH